MFVTRDFFPFRFAFEIANLLLQKDVMSQVEGIINKLRAQYIDQGVQFLHSPGDFKLIIAVKERVSTHFRL